MSDSTEDLKNIDSYGVWVKRPPQDAFDTTEENFEEPAVSSDKVSVEEPVISEDLLFDSLNTDSTLSDEEVSNIQENISESEDTASNDTSDDFFKEDLPTFDSIVPEESDSLNSETEQNTDSSISDISLDNFVGSEGFEDPNKAFDPKEEEVKIPEIQDISENASQDAPSSSEAEPVFEDGEISLDDFMDGDFSDSGSSAPSENATSDEISLDDFFDDDSSSQKEDDVSNDEPLDIDLSFTENAEDVVPTEDADSSDKNESSAFVEDDMFDSISSDSANDTPTESNTEATATEEVSLDDFGLDENSDDATAVAAGNSVNAQASGEEVDLSDFGIDSEAGETPVKQDVHASKKKVVDYDIAITEDDPGSEKLANEVETLSEVEVVAEENKNDVKVDSSVLDMIMQELSGLKNEINSLKDEFNSLKENAAVTEKVPETQVTNTEVNNIPVEETPVQETSEEADIALPSETENTGFFDDDDQDETIALSGDELSNIMNTADITETENSDGEKEDFDIPEELPKELRVNQEDETQTEVQAEENPQDILESESSIEDDTVTESITENVTEDETEQETIQEPTQISEETVQTENEETSPIVEETAEETVPEDFNENEPFGNIDEASSIEEEPDSGLSMNIDEEKLEEPDLDNIDTYQEEEISLPKADELVDDKSNAFDNVLVESSNSDLMDSFENTDESSDNTILQPEDSEKTEEVAEDATAENKAEDVFYNDFIAEDPTVSDTISEENIDYLNEDKNNAAPSTENAEINEEPVTLSQENPESVQVEQTESTEQVEQSEENTSKDEKLPDDLKNDVKSVLLYMDQLLENLPEDKIIEFARSEQFATYKKLFTELGLNK